MIFADVNNIMRDYEYDIISSMILSETRYVIICFVSIGVLILITILIFIGYYLLIKKENNIINAKVVTNTQKYPQKVIIKNYTVNFLEKTSKDKDEKKDL